MCVAQQAVLLVAFHTHTPKVLHDEGSDVLLGYKSSAPPDEHLAGGYQVGHLLKGHLRTWDAFMRKQQLQHALQQKKTPMGHKSE